MEPKALRTTLDTLRSEREVIERRAIELRDEMEIVGQRLTNLCGAIENIEALLDEPSEDDRAVMIADISDLVRYEYSRGGTPRRVDVLASPDPSTQTTITDVKLPRRKRLPSTDWVADAVNAIGRPADRETIYAKFEETRGIPESWVSNPRNSFNNALGRAVERGMIRKLSESVFAPMQFKTFEDADLVGTEG